MGRHRLTWEDFSRAILTKYCKLDYGQIVGSFNKLKLVRGIENYIEGFEDLRASMLEFNPPLIENNFLHSFISGLQDEIRYTVTMFKPQTLEIVYELVENEEKKMEAQRRKASYNRDPNHFNRTQQSKPFEKANTPHKLALD